MSKKNKRKRLERFLDKTFKHYSSKRPIKDIDNNMKHAPKGQR